MDQREMEWNAEVTKIQHTNYVRNSRAITVAWFVFSACYTILNIVAFIQPFWFGDTTESPGVGYFGLYERCERVQGSDYKCDGDFLDFNTIQNDYFRAASFLVGGASLLFIFSIICMLLFLFLKPRIVLKLCGILQLIAALFMAVACIIYPNAFDDNDVRRICGQDATAYNMDKCRIRWAYILAIVLIFDALILAVLAFVLAARQAKMFPEFKKLKEDQ
ncbi:LHFPL tetraspan subfamily member 3 protein-like isoform X2 [Mercenaria mercenaria]|uniref:LHFPL tetraspan subfamily member 3 protein-like isoform X2 n=1 Tax=Mercenaria mercenaria TaxID=6596 RepID=UPI001E1D68A3|nr:LHFPL tetraspan subfamily member 3 protein-like isoform X2 [Mercenaria mercenaria]